MIEKSAQGLRDHAQLSKNLSYTKVKEEKEAQPEKSAENAEEGAAVPKKDV